MCRKREVGCARAYTVYIYIHKYLNTDTYTHWNTHTHTYTRICNRIHANTEYCVFCCSLGVTTQGSFVDVSFSSSRNSSTKCSDQRLQHAMDSGFAIVWTGKCGSHYLQHRDRGVWLAAGRRISESTRDGYYDTFIRIAAYGVFSRNQSSQISCHCVVRAVLFSKGTQIRVVKTFFWNIDESTFFCRVF